MQNSFWNAVQMQKLISFGRSMHSRIPILQHFNHSIPWKECKAFPFVSVFMNAEKKISMKRKCLSDLAAKEE